MKTRQTQETRSRKCGFNIIMVDIDGWAKFHPVDGLLVITPRSMGFSIILLIFLRATRLTNHPDYIFSHSNCSHFVINHLQLKPISTSLVIWVRIYKSGLILSKWIFGSFSIIPGKFLFFSEVSIIHLKSNLSSNDLVENDLAYYPNIYFLFFQYLV